MERISAKQAAEMLGFTTTNLKHYASLLEQNGLNIYRNSRNHREYTQYDIKILKAMQYLNREKSMSLEDAASKVTESDFDPTILLSQELSQIIAQNDVDVSVVKQETDNAIKILSEISTIIAVQKMMRDELLLRDKEQSEFMSSIKETLAKQAEVMKEQVATIEGMSKEIETLRKQQTEKKSSFWRRFFDRKSFI